MYRRSIEQATTLGRSCRAHPHRRRPPLPAGRAPPQPVCPPHSALHGLLSLHHHSLPGQGAPRISMPMSVCTATLRGGLRAAAAARHARQLVLLARGMQHASQPGGARWQGASSSSGSSSGTFGSSGAVAGASGGPSSARQGCSAAAWLLRDEHTSRCFTVVCTPPCCDRHVALRRHLCCGIQLQRCCGRRRRGGRGVQPQVPAAGRAGAAGWWVGPGLWLEVWDGASNTPSQQGSWHGPGWREVGWGTGWGLPSHPLPVLRLAQRRLPRCCWPTGPSRWRWRSSGCRGRRSRLVRVRVGGSKGKGTQALVVKPCNTGSRACVRTAMSRPWAAGYRRRTAGKPSTCLPLPLVCKLHVAGGCQRGAASHRAACISWTPSPPSTGHSYAASPLHRQAPPRPHLCLLPLSPLCSCAGDLCRPACGTAGVGPLHRRCLLPARRQFGGGLAWVGVG